MSDEVNRLMEHRASDRLPAMADVYPRGVSIATMSKSWGGGGMDVGWAVFQETELRSKMYDRMYFETVNNSRAGELQAIMALRASREILLVELGQVIDDPSLRRPDEDAITVADLTGVGVQDLQIAAAVAAPLP